MSNFMLIATSILTAFALVVLIGPWGIPALERIKVGQSIREEGPESHQKKTGTPTMGGIMIVIAITIATIAIAGVNLKTMLLLFSAISFGAVGFIDDYIKVVLKRNLGLRAYQKILFQLLISITITVIYVLWIGDTVLYVPFLSLEGTVDLGIFFIPFMIFVIIGTVNSVNLTDGLDGLASGVTGITAGFFTYFAYTIGMFDVAVFGGTIAGGCVGFLLFNRHPAKVFMGDTGSLALGGAISVMALVTGSFLFMPIAGGIFFLESLSVIIQVASFKKTGKRVFRMSPIHHHFELIGWKETVVVRRFWSATALLCAVAYFGII